MGASLGWGDGGLEGDMGLSQDGPIGPSQQANPQDSPPMAPRHPTRAPNPSKAAIGCSETPPAGPQLTGWPIEGAVADDVEVEVEDGLARAGSVVDHDAVVFEAGIGGDPICDEQQVAE